MSVKRLARATRVYLSADHASQIALGRVGALGFSTLSVLLIARAIGPEGRGLTSGVLAAFFLVPIALAFGVPLEVRRLAAAHPASEVLRSSRVLVLISAPIAVLVGVVLTSTVFAQLGEQVRAWTLVGLALAPAMISWMCDQSVLIAQERYRGVAVMQMCQPVAAAVIVAGLAAAGRLTVSGVLIANIAGTLVTAGLGLALTGVSGGGSRVPLGALVRRAVSFAGSSIAEAASNRLDQVLALLIIGAVQAGYYSVAVALGALPLALGHAIGASYFNEVARADPADRRAVGLAGMRSSLTLGLIASAALAGASALLVTWVFGAAFAPAVPVTLITLLGAPFAVASYVGSMSLAADGRGWRMTAVQVAGLAVGIGGLVVLGRLWGAIGAASASSGAFMAIYAFTVLAHGPGSVVMALPRPSDAVSAVRHGVSFRRTSRASVATLESGGVQ